jgi:hypothetical protein
VEQAAQIPAIGSEYGRQIPFAFVSMQQVYITSHCVASASGRRIQFVRIEIGRVNERPDVAFRGPYRGGWGVEDFEGMRQCGERSCLGQLPSVLGMEAKIGEARTIGFDDRRFAA